MVNFERDHNLGKPQEKKEPLTGHETENLENFEHALPPDELIMKKEDEENLDKKKAA